MNHLAIVICLAFMVPLTAQNTEQALDRWLWEGEHFPDINQDIDTFTVEISFATLHPFLGDMGVYAIYNADAEAITVDTCYLVDILPAVAQIPDLHLTVYPLVTLYSPSHRNDTTAYVEPLQELKNTHPIFDKLRYGRPQIRLYFPASCER